FFFFFFFLTGVSSISLSGLLLQPGVPETISETTMRTPPLNLSCPALVSAAGLSLPELKHAALGSRSAAPQENQAALRHPAADQSAGAARPDGASPEADGDGEAAALALNATMRAISLEGRFQDDMQAEQQRALEALASHRNLKDTVERVGPGTESSDRQPAAPTLEVATAITTGPRSAPTVASPNVSTRNAPPPPPPQAARKGDSKAAREPSDREQLFSPSPHSANKRSAAPGGFETEQLAARKDPLPGSNSAPSSSEAQQASPETSDQPPRVIPPWELPRPPPQSTSPMFQWKPAASLALQPKKKKTAMPVEAEPGKKTTFWEKLTGRSGYAKEEPLEKKLTAKEFNDRFRTKPDDTDEEGTSEEEEDSDGGETEGSDSESDGRGGTTAKKPKKLKRKDWNRAVRRSKTDAVRRSRDENTSRRSKSAGPERTRRSKGKEKRREEDENPEGGQPSRVSERDMPASTSPPHPLQQQQQQEQMRQQQQMRQHARAPPPAEPPIAENDHLEGLDVEVLEVPDQDLQDPSLLLLRSCFPDEDASVLHSVLEGHEFDLATAVKACRSYGFREDPAAVAEVLHVGALPRI
ncbi:MAG: hypothetical protein BJ554DRAFT_2222, partial [Olpidium bornovanus]